MKLTKHIDCADKCQIPEGRTLVRVPTPRHAWNDVIRCPNCGDCFLVEPNPEAVHQALHEESGDA